MRKRSRKFLNITRRPMEKLLRGTLSVLWRWTINWYGSTEMCANIVECEHDQLVNGMELEVAFDDVTDEITMPKWRPAGK